ncbi:hypothetical protein V5799_014600 [Amblyomma americanum]|uniref:ABC transporter domain-containing protein n=1 Tax=Amblyomma americanum TaxID=6943 RepID=A0AAQ4E2J5_AMBAM
MSAADNPDGKEPSSEEKSVREEKRFVASLMQYLLTADPGAATPQAGGGGEAGADASSKAVRAPAGLVVLEVTKTGTLGPLSFHVPPGEVFGILGLGQAGRSLLLRMVTGTVRPDSGNVYINGIDASRRPLHVRPPMLRRVETPRRHSLRTLGLESVTWCLEQHLSSSLVLTRMTFIRSWDSLLQVGGAPVVGADEPASHGFSAGR